MTAPAAAPVWRKSRRSGTDPYGNCVEAAVIPAPIPAAGGVCNNPGSARVPS